MSSTDLLHDPIAPDPSGSAAGGPDGFLDCRGEWHSWVAEEDE